MSSKTKSIIKGTALVKRRTCSITAKSAGLRDSAGRRLDTGALCMPLDILPRQIDCERRATEVRGQERWLCLGDFSLRYGRGKVVRAFVMKNRFVKRDGRIAASFF